MAQDDIYPDFPDSELSHPIDLPGQQTTEHQLALALQERLRTPVALGGQEDHVAHRDLDGRLCHLCHPGLAAYHVCHGLVGHIPLGA